MHWTIWLVELLVQLGGYRRPAVFLLIYLSNSASSAVVLYHHFVFPKSQ
jgi:hypothetical protein